MCRIVIVLLMFGLLPVSAFADKIFMKDGRIIQADRVWQEAGNIYYTKYGATIGHPISKVDRVETVSRALGGDKKSPLKFDVWALGITIDEAIDVAERNDIPLHRESHYSVNKHFNPKMCRPYANSHSKFYYKAQLLGRSTTVNLVFNPSSRVLIKINVDLYDPAGKPHKDSYYEVLAMLVDKFGKPTKSKRNILLRKIKQWVVGDGMVQLIEFGNMARVEYAEMV
jgi:hypothetical protein